MAGGHAAALRLSGSVGFFYVEGHGIETEEVDRLHSLAKQFFSLPGSVKECGQGPAAPWDLGSGVRIAL